MSVFALVAMGSNCKMVATMFVCSIFLFPDVTEKLPGSVRAFAFCCVCACVCGHRNAALTVCPVHFYDFASPLISSPGMGGLYYSAAHHPTPICRSVLSVSTSVCL